MNKNVITYVKGAHVFVGCYGTLILSAVILQYTSDLYRFFLLPQASDIESALQREILHAPRARQKRKYFHC